MAVGQRVVESVPGQRRGRAFVGVITLSTLLTYSPDSLAVSPRKGADSKVRVQPRSLRRPDRDERASVRVLENQLGSFLVEMDDQHGAPARLLLEGISVPRSVAVEGVALEHATSLLASIVDELRPGADPADYRLRIDDLDARAGIRTLAFEQTLNGYAVEAGGVWATISFRYKHDRLIAIANETLPLRAPVLTAPALDAAQVRQMARAHELAATGDGGRVSFELAAQPHYLLAERSGKSAPQLVFAVEARHSDTRDAARLLLDARTGELVERRSLVFFGDSQLRYDVPVRWPEGGRTTFPVGDASVDLSSGETVTTPANGVVNYPGNSILFSHDMDGPFAALSSDTTETVTASGQFNDGSPTFLGFPDDEVRDAQLTSFVHTNLVKARVRSIAPEFEFVDEQLPVNVNIQDTCNAFWNGQSINFFLEGSGCSNTGRLADVVYHEFGHGVHQNAIIPGVGAMGGSLSEGISDYLASTIVDDSGMGRGFFLGSGEALRELDPPDFEWTWPDDIGGVHDEGRIIGGAFWDLRTSLRQKYGNADGTAYTDYLWFQSIRRSVDIPSAYFETLVADDDDGNLANGTPNVCQINEAFGAHGLFQVPGTADSLKLADTGDFLELSMQLEFPYPQCGTEAEVTVTWRDRDEPGEVGVAEMFPVPGDQWIAELPRPADGTVLQYAVDINWNVGTKEHLPSNIVDPWYETYVGPVIPLYCTSFEGGFEDWEIVGGGWQADTTAGPNGSGDPQAAQDGAWWVGNGLSGSGLYTPGAWQQLVSPPIETLGYTDIRLQYWRDLEVEDGFFDRASIYANDSQAWQNFASLDDYSATRHHRDASWRFHDVPLENFVDGDLVELAFWLESDGGLEFGGWNIDNLCVVAIDGPVCGNGLVEAGEECDDGNNEDGDGCSSACQIEPDPGTDDDDDGGFDESEAGTGFGGGFTEPQLAARGCNCQSDGQGSPAALLMFGLFALGLRRRRA